MQTAVKQYAVTAAFHPQPASQEKKPVAVFSGGIGEDVEQLKAVEEFLFPNSCDSYTLLTPEEQRLCDMATD